MDLSGFPNKIRGFPSRDVAYPVGEKGNGTFDLVAFEGKKFLWISNSSKTG